METENQTIELTPTWVGVLPYLIVGIESGNAEGRAIALKELQRMARAADKCNAIMKGNAP